MTTTERDLLIAEAMGLEIKNYDGLYYTKINDHWQRWNPSENAEQREKIENWVIEIGYGIEMFRSKNETNFLITGVNKPRLTKTSNQSKSTAFLEAVGELCVTLKNQK